MGAMTNIPFLAYKEEEQSEMKVGSLQHQPNPQVRIQDNHFSRSQSS